MTVSASDAGRGMFRALATYNYRIWAGGALVSNVGTWMQRIAQDWLVLTQLTHNNATAVGVVTALQFAPQLLLLPLTGVAADHLDRRKLLIATQGAMGALALGLGALTVLGVVQLWQVYVFALLLGVATAFDAPARHTFVAELVGEADLSNAVALNSTSFNAARMIGPFVAGAVIARVGSGWAFIANGASFAAVIGSLLCLRERELHPRTRAGRDANLADGFGYIWSHPEIRSGLVMLMIVGTFGINFPLFISTMSVSVFHVGAPEFGFLTSVMAIGSIIGALLAAARARPQLSLLVIGAATLGAGLVVAAVMPNYQLFGLVLIVIGVAAQTFTTTALALVQLTTESQMRGRVMAIALAITLGGVAVGGPILGRVADRFGPRAALVVAAASGFVAAAIGLRALLRARP